MYRCESCQTVVPAGTPRTTVVVETRPKTYDITRRLSEKEQRRALRRGMNVDTSRQYAQGWEIIKEMVVCPTCRTNKPELAESLEAQLRAHAERKVASADDADGPAPVEVTVGPAASA